MWEVGQCNDQIVQLGFSLFQLFIELFGTLFECYRFSLLAALVWLWPACLVFEHAGRSLAMASLLARLIQFCFGIAFYEHHPVVRCDPPLRRHQPLHGQTFERKGFVVSDLLKCQHVSSVLYFIFDISSQWSKDTNFSYLCHYEAYFCPYTPKCCIDWYISTHDVERLRGSDSFVRVIQLLLQKRSLLLLNQHGLQRFHPCTGTVSCREIVSL